MKLYITRNQATGFLGKVKFVLKARVELTADELSLVEKYKCKNELLLLKELIIPFINKTFLLELTIGSFIDGQEFKCKDIADILQYEANVKEACETFKNYIEVMKSFGGEEMIEYEV
jgi:hypothetical protein